MKKLAIVVGLVVAVVVAVPLVSYGTLSPCEMVKRELVERARTSAQSLSERGREEVGGLGEDVQRVAEEIGKAVEDVAAGVAAGLAEARVEEMSVGECVRELIRLKTGGEP